MSTGEHIIVEMQNVRQSAFRDRMLFYAAAPIRKQAPKGAWDFKLKRVYSIGILKFTLDKADLSVSVVQCLSNTSVRSMQSNQSNI